MLKNDLMKLISAWDAFVDLNSVVMDLNGGIGIDARRYKGLWDLYDIIQSNSMFCGVENDERQVEFLKILWDRNLTSKEKYEKITD
ncbi:MAG: hypothetical protein K6B68_06625 [Eubacterium sp.]|nr:hypothetical protein [Eubacterium sp.]